MRPTRHSLVLLSAAAFLLLYAFLLDSAPALFLSGSIAGLVAWRAFSFLHSAKILASGTSVRRDATPAFLRQGGAVKVACTVQFTLPRGLRVAIADRPPAGAQVTGGTATAVHGIPGPATVPLAYAISPFSCGRLPFRGLDIVVQDAFFSLLLPFRGGSFSSPTLWVDPVARFRPGEGTQVFGEVEGDARALLQGHGVRSFREYIPGDDPRMIDWKLTAKHGKVFVRELSGLEGKSPLLVVDLPDGSVPFPARLRDAVLGAALDAAREMCKSPRGCSLMVISGPNLLSFLPGGRSPARVEKALREYHSPPQAVRCYRLLDPGIAEGFRQRLAGEAAGTGGEEFTRRLLEVYNAFVPAVEPIPFEVQCARALARERETALYVLSHGTGDPSHLAILGLHARRRGIDARIGIPEEALSPGLVRRLRGSGFSAVRVIA
ncbi:MAG: DUF58 domain-containing protein [Methanolinea sp.]|nr:DUF58 domain-containing protein [Methanolinea sp.]